MKNLLIILCLLLGACAQTPTADLAIRGATIVDVTDGSLSSGQTVLVEGDRIVAVGPVAEVAVPDDAEVVDAPDGYLIPELWYMHALTSSIPIGTWVTPTLVAGERLPSEIELHWSEDPRLRYLPREELKLWGDGEEDFDVMGGDPEHEQTLAHFEREVTLAMLATGKD